MCGVCAVLKNELAEASQKQRKVVQETLDLHLKQADTAREHYELMRSLALDMNRGIDMIELDGKN